MNQERISIVNAMFFRALVTFLRNPLKKNRAALLLIAQKTGEVDRKEMPFITRRDFSKGFDEMLKKLEEKDQEEWIQILGRARQTEKEKDFKNYFGKLKEMSPFSGDMLLQLTNRTIGWELVDILEDMVQSRGLKRDGWYILSIPDLKFNKEKTKIIPL